MQILQLSKYYPPKKGGIELVAQMFSKAHIDLNDSVSIISFGKKNKKYRGTFGEKIEQISEDLFMLSTPISFSLFFNFKKILESKDIDKIYIHLPNPYMHHLVYHYRKLLKKKNILLSAIYHSDLVNQKVLGPIYDGYFNKTSNIYDEVICSSDNLWQSSKVLTKFSESKKRIIPYCTDIQNQFIKRKKFSGNLVSIGRLVPYKGYEFLINAINDSPYKLTIIGDGPLFSKLKNIAKANITLTGGVSEDKKNEIINSSDLYILSSINRSEAYGMVIVEAFQNGLPVIASNINSGVTYLAKNFERGFVFDTLSKDSLLKCIKNYQKNSTLLSEQSERARTFFEKNLTYKSFLSHVKNL